MEDDDLDLDEELLLLDQRDDAELTGRKPPLTSELLADLRVALRDHAGEPVPSDELRAAGHDHADVLLDRVVELLKAHGASGAKQVRAVVELVRVGPGTPARALASIRKPLTDLGLLDDDGAITPLGAWTLPRALARRWGGTIDGPPGSSP